MLPDDASPQEREPAVSSPALSTRDRLGAVLERGRRWLPWLSLAAGLVGAFLMDRSPKSAWLIVAIAVLGWGTIIGFTALARLDPAAYEGRRRQVVKAARFVALVGSQSLMQNGLLFALPFYVQAAAWTLPQVGFLLAMTAAAAVTLWDPLYERVVAGRWAALALQGFASFCALNAVLPSLGASNGVSLVLAALVAAAGVPLQSWVLAPLEKKKQTTLVTGIVAGLALPLLVAGWGAPAIPPAPLGLSDGGLGLAVEDKELRDRVEGELVGVPAALFCWTAVRAPRGLKDELFHVWRQDGAVVDKVKLVVSGGRDAGFRTWSKKTRFGKRPYGRWSCSVQTPAGQVLGRRHVDVKPSPEAG